MLLLETIAADSLSSDMTGALSAGLLLEWAQLPLCILCRGRQCLPGALQVRCLAIQVPACVVLRALCTPAKPLWADVGACLVPMALLKELSVLLMIRVRRPESLTVSASRWQIELFISLRLEATCSRIKEAHLSGRHMGCGTRQTLKVGTHDMPVSVRVRWCYTTRVI